jgi:hypothetical protein
MKKSLVILTGFFFFAMATQAQYEVKKTQDANSPKTRVYHPVKYKPVVLKSASARPANTNKDRMGNFEIQTLMSDFNNSAKDKRKMKVKKS